MNLITEFAPIRQWAMEKGIINKGSFNNQLIKLVEEVGEIAHASLRQDGDGVKDGIGDCVVVLTSLAHFAGLRIEDCINSAYDQIKNRTGQMINENFVKDDD